VLKQEREERESVWKEKAIEVEKQWAEFSPVGITPYISKKMLSENFGARVAQNDHGDPILCVPAYDVEGKLWNYQRIYAQKLEHGDKFFCEGARIEGCFHLLSFAGEQLSLASATLVYICEGFATAGSIKMALGAGHHVVSAFNAGNLEAVAREIRAKYPSLKIVIAADNDAYTVINGREVNVGIDKARRAAGAVGGELVWPVFKHPTRGLTDFNDLHAAEGLEKVRDNLENFAKYVKGILPLALASKKNGQLIPPTEKQISDYLLKHFDGKLVQVDRSIFRYNGTHWTELNYNEINQIKQFIALASNHLYGIRDIENALKYLHAHLPKLPSGVDLFQPNPYAANFANGTVHLRPGYLEFAPHKADDYLTSTLPFDWPGEVPHTCPEFDDMVGRLWAGCSDLAQINDLIDELIGACLCPAFPVIAFFTGKPNSGKSTMIKLLVRLVSRENVCSVQLCDLNGFNMESMVGKLVNFDTDIDIQRPMNDSEVKKIIDRVPRRVRRKGRSDVYAYLPAVHLFASNGLPKSLDGASHAYGRRFVIVQTESWQAEKPVMDFEVKLLEKELPGILVRGIRGMRRLLANGGQYTVPPTSHERVAALEADSDVFGQFLDDVKCGEVFDKSTRLVIDSEARVERKVLWEIFDAWQDVSVKQQGAKLGKKQFFGRVESGGFRCIQSQGIRRFVGLGVVVQPDSTA